jgi:hypothetical protein
MALVSLCMPSRRPLATARPSIDNMIAYARARNFRLIISDNSDGLDKAGHYAHAADRVTVLQNPGAGPLENLMRTVEAADTPFILPVGDDDFIENVAGAPGIDLARLPADCVGARPTVVIFAEGEPELRRLDYGLPEETAVDRFHAYAQRRGGCNSLYYSFFRRDSFLAVHEPYWRQRKTVIGDFDWAVTTSLLFEGKVAHDPSTLYRYDLGRWRQQASIDATVRSFYLDAGLPDMAAKFHTLFKYIDIYVTTQRPSLRLSDLDRLKALYTATIALLGSLLRNAAQTPDRYRGFEDTIAEIRTAVSDHSDDLSSVFDACARIAGRMKPGFEQELHDWLAATRAAH